MHTSPTPRFLISVSTCSQQLGALAAVTDPQPQDVPLPVHRDAQGDVDRPIGDTAIADLHLDRVDENDRVHRIQRPRLPGPKALQHPVGDHRDGLPGDLGAVDLGQVRLHLPGGQALGDQRHHQVLHPAKAPLALAHDLGLEAGVTVTGHLEFHGADLGQDRLGAVAVARVAAVAPRRVAGLVAQVVGELALQGALQHQLGELLQQPVRADQADPPLTGLGDQPCDQLLVDQRPAALPPSPRSAGPAASCPSCGVSSGVPTAHSVMELHRCIYSPDGDDGDGGHGGGSGGSGAGRGRLRDWHRATT